MSRKGGLGKGLTALIPAEEKDQGGLLEAPISAISPNPRQPRGVFDDDELAGLAASITEVGLLQPIVVRRTGTEQFELIAGERRLRASKLAGLTRIPVIVRDTPDDELLREALIENIHRVQLNPLEEAAAYRQLLDDFGVTQEELASRLGKSRPTLTNSLRLLGLPPQLQRKVAAGVLSAGHAKALLALDDRELMQRLGDRIVQEGMSVRETEEAVRLRLIDGPTSVSEATSTSPANGSSPSKPKQTITAPGLLDLQERLSDELMARVRISMGARTGKLQIEFGSVDDLERIVGVIARGLQSDIDVPTA